MVTKNPRYTQPELGIGYGTAREVDPVPHIQAGAKSYAESQGRTYDQTGLDTSQVDPRRGHAQFLAYRQSMDQEPSADTVASYHAMRTEVGQQFDFMTKPAHEGGLGIGFEATPHDPYPARPGATTAQQMAEDVTKNNRIKVHATGGDESHAFFTNEENDKFRAVHDVFGHLATGRGTTRHGEEAAYLSHAQMFSPKAREALASETRGQNSYLNYGPGGFPEQSKRLVSMPKWATEQGKLPGD